MIALADHNRVKTFLHKLLQTAMRNVDKRTRSLQHVQSAPTRFFQNAFGRAVRRDHHRLRSDIGRLPLKANSLRTQFRQHGFVVDQIAQNRKRLAFHRLQSQGNGILYPKTHSQMFGAYDFHINFVSQSKRPQASISVQNNYLGLFCRTIFSSRLMYSAKALRPGAVSEQVVSGRLFWNDFATAM